MKYQDFLSRKSQLAGMCGFEPLWMPDFLFDFQKHLVGWGLRAGRSLIAADCGMGKTPMELVWAQNVAMKTNKPVLLCAPLAVSHQMLREANKFGIEAGRSSDGRVVGKITITNYERMHHFNRHEFGGVACDESSILKNFDGATKAVITEFMREIPYRFLGTATAAPNDYWELGTSSEALGYLGHTDMITKFFKEDVVKDYLGWGRKTYRFRGHSEQIFWRWVCSWARVCRKPSDLGFADGDFVLPDLIEREHVVESSTPRPGFLFSTPANDLREQRVERRVTLRDRCEAAASIVASMNGHASALWCQLNDEGDLLESIIPGAVQVSGQMSDEEKEEKILAFQSGEIKRFIIKPKIGCFGLNWQHCHNVVTFASHSWEQYYQLVRRCWRFGQKHAVTVTSIASQGEIGVLKNLQRKASQANKMFASLSRHANEALKIDGARIFHEKEQVPSWL